MSTKTRLILLTAFIFFACGVSWSAGYLTARQEGGRSPIVLEKCSAESEGN